MSNFRKLVGVTLTHGGPVTYGKNEEEKISEDRPNGVDLRVPVIYKRLGVWFFTAQGQAALSTFRTAELGHDVFPEDGTTCLISRPGPLQRYTTRNGQEFKMAEAAKIVEVDDACVDPHTGLYAAGIRNGVPKVVLFDGDGVPQKDWSIGNEGELPEWGAAGQGYVGYLVGPKLMVKAPRASTFKQLEGPPSASKVFWADGDGGGLFFLRCNDGLIRCVHPETGETQDVTRLEDGEDFLRVDPTARLGRVDLLITTGPSSYRTFHI